MLIILSQFIYRFKHLKEERHFFRRFFNETIYTNIGATPRFNQFSISVQLQIEEISRKLRTGDLGIATAEERFEQFFSFSIFKN